MALMGQQDFVRNGCMEKTMEPAMLFGGFSNELRNGNNGTYYIIQG